jgi:hypothetical protein
MMLIKIEGYIGNTKWHNQASTEKKFGIRGGFPFVTKTHSELVVATTQDYVREDNGAT